MTTRELLLGARTRPGRALRAALLVGAAILAALLWTNGLDETTTVTAASSADSPSNANGSGSGPPSDDDAGGDDEADGEDGPSEGGSDQPDPGVPAGMPTDPPDELGKPFDPLGSEEKGYARSQALQAQDGAGQQLDGSDGYEFLTVDRADPERKAEGNRAAKVVSYDYAADVTVFQYVDLATGEVTTKTSPDAALPPSNEETEAAMRILLDSPEGEDLREQYEDAMGSPLESAEDIRYIGGAYFNAAGTAGLAECETSRCVEFQIQTADGSVLEANAIVDLSAQTARPIEE